MLLLDIGNLGLFALESRAGRATQEKQVPFGCLFILIGMTGN